MRSSLHPDGFRQSIFLPNYHLVMHRMHLDLFGRPGLRLVDELLTLREKIDQHREHQED